MRSSYDDYNSYVRSKNTKSYLSKQRRRIGADNPMKSHEGTNAYNIVKNAKIGQNSRYGGAGGYSVPKQGSRKEIPASVNVSMNYKNTKQLMQSVDRNPIAAKETTLPVIEK